MKTLYLCALFYVIIVRGDSLGISYKTCQNGEYWRMSGTGSCQSCELFSMPLDTYEWQIHTLPSRDIEQKTPTTTHMYCYQVFLSNMALIDAIDSSTSYYSGLPLNRYTLQADTDNRKIYAFVPPVTAIFYHLLPYSVDVDIAYTMNYITDQDYSRKIWYKRNVSIFSIHAGEILLYNTTECTGVFAYVIKIKNEYYVSHKHGSSNELTFHILDLTIWYSADKIQIVQTGARDDVLVQCSRNIVAQDRIVTVFSHIPPESSDWVLFANVSILPDKQLTGLDFLKKPCTDACVKGQHIIGACKSSSKISQDALCQQCPEGKYSSTGVTCLFCDAYQVPTETQESCSYCPSGKYKQDNGNVVECVACYPGSYRINNMPVTNNCILCQDGKTPSSLSTQTCVDCSRGKYGTDGICIPCGTGTYSNTSGGLACIQCLKGEVNGNKDTCVPCNAGYAPNDGVCVKCAAGTIQYENDEPCTECWDLMLGNQLAYHVVQGEILNPAGASAKTNAQCVTCEPGYERRSAEATGVVSSTIGDICIACDEGYYTSSLSRCVVCPDDSERLQEIQDMHVHCKDGMFADISWCTEKSRIPLACAHCVSCPANTRSTGLCHLRHVEDDLDIPETQLNTQAVSTYDGCKDCDLECEDKRNYVFVSCFQDLLSTQSLEYARSIASNLSPDLCRRCPDNSMVMLSPNFMQISDYNSSVYPALSFLLCICETNYEPMCGNTTCRNYMQLGFKLDESVHAIDFYYCRQCDNTHFQDINYSTHSYPATQSISSDFFPICLPCHPGSFKRGDTCELCEKGTYTDKFGQTACVACDVSQGFVSEHNGATKCALCQAGKVWHHELKKCAICEAGKYIAQHTCKTCTSFGLGTGYCENRRKEYINQFDIYVNDSCVDVANLRGQYSICGVTRDAQYKAGACSSEQFFSDVSYKCEKCSLPYKLLDGVCILESDCGVGTEILSNICQCQLGRERTSAGCLLCNRGSYKDRPGDFACTPCPSNTTTIVRGASMLQQCSYCTQGFYYNPISQGCEKCPLCTTTQQETHRLSICEACTISDLSFTEESTCFFLDCIHEVDLTPVYKDTLSAVSSQNCVVERPLDYHILEDSGLSMSSAKITTYTEDYLADKEVVDYTFTTQFRDWYEDTQGERAALMRALDEMFAGSPHSYRGLFYTHDTYMYSIVNNFICASDDDITRSRLVVDSIDLCNSQENVEECKQIKDRVDTTTPWFDLIRAWYKFYNLNIYIPELTASACFDRLRGEKLLDRLGVCEKELSEYTKNNGNRAHDIATAAHKYMHMLYSVYSGIMDTHHNPAFRPSPLECPITSFRMNRTHNVCVDQCKGTVVQMKISSIRLTATSEITLKISEIALNFTTYDNQGVIMSCSGDLNCNHITDGHTSTFWEITKYSSDTEIVLSTPSGDAAALTDYAMRIKLVSPPKAIVPLFLSVHLCDALGFCYESAAAQATWDPSIVYQDKEFYICQEHGTTASIDSPKSYAKVRNLTLGKLCGTASNVHS